MNSRPLPPVLAAGVVLALVAAPAALAATHLVPEDFATITEALEASEWGDEIVVGPGVYKESLVFTDAKGDGVALRSTSGPTETTIQYGEVANQNEAVITLQRCSNSTQVRGFKIDGRQVAKRGILANSNTRAVFQDLVIEAAEYGIAAHRQSIPYVRDCTVQNSLTAGLFIQGGSADVKDCRFLSSEKFGIYIRGTGSEARFRGCVVTGNGQVGVQATDGDFTFTEGTVSGNGDTGFILQDVSPEITYTTVEGHANVGIVMDASSAVIQHCTVRDNNFGAVISIEGEPKILNCTFEHNPSYHIGVEGDANPLIGGSKEGANRFLGEPAFAIQSSSTAVVVATHNYWDKPCAPAKLFQISNGKLRRKPWMSGNLAREFDDCDAARKYNKKWKRGKLDESGEPIGQESDDTAAEASPAASEPVASAELGDDS